jgi:cell division transport system permease protein
VVAAAAVAFATRARLAVRGAEIEILHLMGAQDAAIAREFALDALRAAALGGAAGALGAGALAWVLAGAVGGLGLGGAALAWASAPIAATAVALVAGATAWLAARAALARLA